MGCFLPCFGSSKDAKCRKHSSKRTKKRRKADEAGVSSFEDYPKTIATSASSSSQVQVDNRPKKRFSLRRKKKATFGYYAQTHKPVLANEVTEKSEEGGKKEDTSSTSSSEDSSLTSLGSYPLNHSNRYQNCQHGDGEDEDLDYSSGSDENDEDDVSEEDNDDEVNKSNRLSSNAGDKTISSTLEPQKEAYTPFSTEIEPSKPNLYEDRPILGALTVEEIREFSDSCTPRKSPCKSPDEMPIIGTVGTYWNCSASIEDSSSDSNCFKGIPNTANKYGEDRIVNWHEIPFETRLERALNSQVL